MLLRSLGSYVMVDFQIRFGFRHTWQLPHDVIAKDKVSCAKIIELLQTIVYCFTMSQFKDTNLII